ncbi:hypothetical protein LIER_24982 [Lithospermum erythrorhizon]|uniref:Retrovirus-related Pol polyprotein from transposon TNT 1-94 n=1 Tax=Lithospermum erythrorhizon TaxID=34254 RepID=A0AAV3R4A6_LITER
MYAMTCTRPDLRYAIVVLSRFLSNPGKEHWEDIKWILKYLKGIAELCIGYGRNTTTLQAYTNVDMAGEIDLKRSTSGYVFVFAGGAVSWQSKLQKCVALSTTEVEYIAVTYTIYLSRNLTFHSRCKLYRCEISLGKGCIGREAAVFGQGAHLRKCYRYDDKDIAKE